MYSKSSKSKLLAACILALSTAACKPTPDASGIRVFVDLESLVKSVQPADNRTVTLRLPAPGVIKSDEPLSALSATTWDNRAAALAKDLGVARVVLEKSGVDGLSRVRKEAETARQTTLNALRTTIEVEERQQLALEEAAIVTKSQTTTIPPYISDGAIGLLQVAIASETAVLGDQTIPELPADLVASERKRFQGTTAHIEKTTDGSLKVVVVYPNGEKPTYVRSRAEIVRDALQKEMQRLATIRDDQLSKVVEGQTSAMNAVRGTAAIRLRQRLDSAESAVPVDVKSAVRQQEVGDVVERILSSADIAMGDVGSSKPVLRHRTAAIAPRQSRVRVFDLSDISYRQRIRREVTDFVQDTARRNGWIAVFDRSSASADKTQFMRAALIRERRFIW
ncbi:MAG: hypothetical protein ACKO14_00540 [Armatimonadota bacterium]